MVTLVDPLLVFGLLVDHVEGLPALGGDLEGAYVGFAAVGFVSGHFFQVLVVDL